jgi:hypothetical protein
VIGADQAGDASFDPAPQAKQTVTIGTTPRKVTSVSPPSGPGVGGTRITIRGQGFIPGDTVVIGQGDGAGIGAIPATRVSVDSPTQITATTGGPAKPGNWHLFVVAPGGTASQATTKDQFTYTMPLGVSSVSPHSGPASGGTLVTITGKGFATGDTVVIGQGNGPVTGAIPATQVHVDSPTQITATTGGPAKPGNWHLFVVAPGGTASQATSGNQFTYYKPVS